MPPLALYGSRGSAARAPQNYYDHPKRGLPSSRRRNSARQKRRRSNENSSLSSPPATKPPSRSSRTGAKFSPTPSRRRPTCTRSTAASCRRFASRKHIEAIAALTDQALKEAGVEKKDIDAVAATYAPGLIGAVLVGLNFAKSAAYALNVPLIPVHHIRGHIAANYLAFPELEPPFLALCMSGGNTLIVDVRDYTDFALLGATRDDAAGECFDKAARVLGLPYPGGAAMDKLAHESEGGVYELPRAKIDGCPLDMSFSGLKTAVVNLAHNAEQTGKQLDRAALGAQLHAGRCRRARPARDARHAAKRA